MRTYFFLFLISVVCSYLLTRMLAARAGERGWANRQGDGGDATGVPRLGGVSVFTTILISLALLILWDNEVAGRILRDVPRIAGLLGAAAIVFALGLYDDIRRARPWQKLLAQTAAASVLFAAGYRVELLSNPFTHAPMDLGWLAFPVTVLWLVAISNAFNLIDGLDGLAAGVGFFATLALFFLALLTANPFVAAIAATMAGALSGFLPHNFAPARIYLGDSGALTTGLILAALAIAGSQKGPVLVAVTIPLLIFGLPLLDAGVTTARRLLSGHPIFRRDEEHLHHRLLKMGLNQRAAVLTLYAMAAVFVLTSLLLLNYRGAIGPVIALVCGVMAWVMVRQMQYPEFAELDSTVRVALSSQRAVLRNHILLRRLSVEALRASSLNDLWDCACRAFASLDFESAVCRFESGADFAGPVLRWSAPHPGAGGNGHSIGGNGHSSGGNGHSQGGNGHNAAVPDSADCWTMSFPLAHTGRRIAVLELTRDVERMALLFRVSSLLEFLSGSVAPRLASLLSNEDAETEEVVSERSHAGNSAVAPMVQASAAGSTDPA